MKFLLIIVLGFIDADISSRKLNSLQAESFADRVTLRKVLNHYQWSERLWLPCKEPTGITCPTNELWYHLVKEKWVEDWSLISKVCALTCLENVMKIEFYGGCVKMEGPGNYIMTECQSDVRYSKDINTFINRNSRSRTSKSSTSSRSSSSSGRSRGR